MDRERVTGERVMQIAIANQAIREDGVRVERHYVFEIPAGGFDVEIARYRERPVDALEPIAERGWSKDGVFRGIEKKDIPLPLHVLTRLHQNCAYALGMEVRMEGKKLYEELVKQEAIRESEEEQNSRAAEG